MSLVRLFMRRRNLHTSREQSSTLKMVASRPGEESVGKELGGSGQDGGGSGQDGGGSSWGGVGGEGTRVKMEAAHPGEESVGKELRGSGQDGGGLGQDGEARVKMAVACPGEESVGKELGGLGQDGGSSSWGGVGGEGTRRIWSRWRRLGSRWWQLVLGRSQWGRNSGDPVKMVAARVKMVAARPGEESVGQELGRSGQDGGGSSRGGVGGEGTRGIGSRWRRLVLGRSWWGRNSGDPVQMEAAHPGEESVGKELGGSGQDVGGEGTRSIRPWGGGRTELSDGRVGGRQGEAGRVREQWPQPPCGINT